MSGDVFERLVTIVDRAGERGAALRALGGVGIHFHTRAAGWQLRDVSNGADLDLATVRRAVPAVEELLPELGYEPQQEFNAMFGDKRLLFHGTDFPQIDVFVDRFAMCHALDLSRGLEREPYTLGLAELALTKLQVHELTRKDALDVSSLLLAFEPEAGGRLDLDALTGPLAADWGFYTTVLDNLDHLAECATAYAPTGAADVLRERVERLSRALATAQKSLRWRMRAKIGRRMPWYELPEETEFAAR
jgi:hypothetical protein